MTPSVGVQIGSATTTQAVFLPGTNAGDPALFVYRVDGDSFSTDTLPKQSARTTPQRVVSMSLRRTGGGEVAAFGDVADLLQRLGWERGPIDVTVLADGEPFESVNGCLEGPHLTAIAALGSIFAGFNVTVLLISAAIESASGKRLASPALQSRATISNVGPLVQRGRYPIKAIVGDRVPVSASAFADSDDIISARILYRHSATGGVWRIAPMERVADSYPPRYSGDFLVGELGRYEYFVEAWVDPFLTWQRSLQRWQQAGNIKSVEFRVGAAFIGAVLERDINAEDRPRLVAIRDAIPQQNIEAALSSELTELMRRYSEPRYPTRSDVYEVVVDPKVAEYGAWYEMFPRSASADPARPGTLLDVIARLPYIAALGFDVLYLPPIHPIGLRDRKGKHGVIPAVEGDPGSPWAIADHRAVHPELGTLEDFHRLVAEAALLGIKLAMDLAFQVAPDHPYVTEHPEWFRVLPDGTIRPAENPPKRYLDVLPFNFEGPDSAGLWNELKGIVEFWIDQGVKIFRVDNPHTKPFGFWEWLIGSIKDVHPDVVFLSEAFTEPYVMEGLAALGFTQSYTHFAWKRTKEEIEGYFGHLLGLRYFFRPSLWPQTPDVIVSPIRGGNEAAFKSRLALAALIGSSYGTYGPVFELGLNEAQSASETASYKESEKFEVRHWDWDTKTPLRIFIARINKIRKENPALQNFESLRFHRIDSGNILAFSKQDGDNVILVYINLDPYNTQDGNTDVDWRALGLHRDEYQVIDLMRNNETWRWSTHHSNYVRLEPGQVHVFRVMPPDAPSFNYTSGNGNGNGGDNGTPHR